MTDSLARRLIIDTDAGVDDAVALMMALAQPGAEVLAITTVAGNVGVDRVTANVLLTLDVMGRDAPVFRGCDRPLFGQAGDSTEFMGPDGLGGAASRYPPSKRRVEAGHGALALARLARQHAGELTLLALGPLTNVALAVHLDSAFARNVGRLVVMGGAVEAKGNASAAGEFNIYCDPEAAAIVFGAGFADLWLVPWETALKYPLPWPDRDSIAGRGTPRAAFFRHATEHIAAVLRDALGLPGLLVPDALAAAVALRPELAATAPHLPVRVETAAGLGRGLTAVDWYRRSGLPPNANLVLDLDGPGALELIAAALDESVI